MYVVQGHELRKLPLLKVMEVSQSLSSQNHGRNIIVRPTVIDRSKLKLRFTEMPRKSITKTSYFGTNFALQFLSLEIITEINDYFILKDIALSFKIKNLNMFINTYSLMSNGFLTCIIRFCLQLQHFQKKFMKTYLRRKIFSGFCKYRTCFKIIYKNNSKFERYFVTYTSLLSVTPYILQATTKENLRHQLPL